MIEKFLKDECRSQEKKYSKQLDISDFTVFCAKNMFFKKNLLFFNLDLGLEKVRPRFEYIYTWV